jgi:enoyl-CoA hydratase/carnithine racemase
MSQARSCHTLPVALCRVTESLPPGVTALGAGRAKAFLLNPQPLTTHTTREWGVASEVVPNGKALARARELASLYMKAPEVTRRNTRAHFIQPLKERIVRESWLRPIARRRLCRGSRHVNASHELRRSIRQGPGGG